MVSIALWLRLRAFLSSAGAWIARNPLLALCAVLAAFSAYSWHGWGKERERFAAYRAAGVEAAKQQADLRASETQAYKDKANVATRQHAANLAAARDDTARYIAAHRVRPEGGSCTADPQRQADPAGQPAPVPAGVVVDQADVQACGDLYAYAVTAHDWALSVAQ